MKFDKNSKKYYELIDVVDRDISKAIQEDKERELLEKKYGKFNLEIEDI